MGSYSPSDNVISLFENANQSTFMHESAHMYLSTLSQLAANGSKEAQAELDTILSWAKYSPEAMADYAGTKLEADFKEIEKKIKDAKTDAERNAAEEEFAQERFARGFERYLMEGKAPNKDLKTIFQRFTKWLKGLYESVKALGNQDIPPAIQQVYDRMLTGEHTPGMQHIEAESRNEPYHGFLMGMSKSDRLGYENRLTDDARDPRNGSVKQMGQLIWELANDPSWQSRYLKGGHPPYQIFKPGFKRGLNPRKAMKTPLLRKKRRVRQSLRMAAAKVRLISNWLKRLMKNWRKSIVNITFVLISGNVIQTNG